MTNNLDIQLGMGRRNGEHMLVADNVPGVGQLSVSINTQQLHELAQTAQHASLEAKGYEELRIEARGVQMGDRMVSFCSSEVTDVVNEDSFEKVHIQIAGGATISTDKTKPVRVLRAIQ